MSSTEVLACSICKKKAELKCSVCKEVAYCSRDHQKSDWQDHRNFCLAYQIETSSNLGRHLIATRDLEPGAIIMSESPLVFGPKSLPDPEQFAPCVGCYRPVNLDVGERCNRCGWPICSGLCKGLLDPRHHGLECLVLSLRPGCAVSQMGDYYRHDALLTLRCLLMQQKFPKKYKKIVELQSHMEDRKPGSEAYEETDEMIVKYLEDKFLYPLRGVENELKTKIVPDISKDLLHKICGIIDVNALEIRLNNGGTELLALYPNVCLMEHSCIPNTKHSFDLVATDECSQLRITVKAAVPIMKGEHITTMYSHALWGTQARRQHLKDTKYFSCTCERCKDPTELGTYIGALRCIGDGVKACGGFQLPDDPLDEETEWNCDSCQSKVKNKEVAYLMTQMGEEVDNVQMSNPSVGQLEDLLTKLALFLHPNHYHMYSIKHSLIQLYGYQNGYLPHQLTKDTLERKIKYCNELIEITKKIDPGNARLSLYIGVLYHELHNAILQTIKNAKTQDKVKDVNIDEMVRTAKNKLEEAIKSLLDEIEGSPGHKLLNVIRETERSFTRWLSANKMKVT